MRGISTATLVAGLLGLAALGVPSTPAQGDLPPPVPAAEPVPDGMQVQARGQIHEAYGEPTQTQALPGVLVLKAPPDPIEEAPPEEKPAGDNVAWIPGYWGWNDEAKDFIWISGFWRVLPPGRVWFPGHWVKATDGFRFVSGFWAPAVGATENHEVNYLPPPPALVENGPSVPAPDATSTYVPGCWIHQVNRFLWRPGYWLGYRPNWVWVAAHYCWTPAGYIFAPGYWDRPLLQRGLLFAPIAFTRPIYRQAGFVYRPSFVIQPDFLLGALFVRPGYPSYYFGDYFTAGYQKRFIPWDTYRPNRFTVDANFGYYRHTYHDNPAWGRNLRALYTGRYDGGVPRPPRTLSLQNTAIGRITANKTSLNVVNKGLNITHLQNQSVLAPVRSMKNVRVTGLSSLAGGGARAVPAARDIRVERATKEHLVAERQAATRFREMSKQRVANEARLVTKAPAKPAPTPQRVKIELPRGTPPARVIHPIKGVPVAPHAETHHPAPRK